MKAKTILFAFAASMMFFVSCSKDDDKNNTLNIEDNTLVYDGAVYHMNAMQSYFHSQLTLVDASSQETNLQQEPMVEFAGLHIRPGMWNRTANIFTETNDTVSWNFVFNGVVEANAYDDFSACMVGIYGNNDGTPVTVTVDGTLKNGKKIQMKVITQSDN